MNSMLEKVREDGFCGDGGSCAAEEESNHVCMRECAYRRLRLEINSSGPVETIATTSLPNSSL